MNKENKTQTDPRIKEAVFSLLSQALFETEPCRIEGVDFDELLRECEHQHIVSLVYGNVRKQQISPDTSKHWEEAMDITLTYNASSQRKHIEIYKRIEETHIPCVIIKGIASASYYPMPLLRGAGDIDIFIKENDIKNADTVLKEMGLSPDPDKKNLESHNAYRKSGYEVEVHWGINGTPSGESGDEIRRELKDILEDSVPYTCNSGTCRIPSMRHHAIIMLIHLATHMMSSGTSLRHLCDWAVFVSGEGEERFERELLPVLKRCGLGRMAQIFTDLSTEYLGLPPQRWAGVSKKDYQERLMDEFFAAGYFGEKNPSRSIENVFYVSSEAGNVNDGNMVGNLFARLNKSVKMSFPVAAKIPVLLPFGWIYIGIRYLFRVNSGKRSKIRVNGMMDSVRERRDIYSKWHLFEKEDDS